MKYDSVPTSGLPLQGAPQSYWQSDGQKQKPDLRVQSDTVSLPYYCDVAIIGGGYAGIATAYQLLKSTSPPPSVVLLEAKEPCSGASGRNGGHLRPEYLMAAASNVKRYSATAAAEILEFEVNHLDVIKSLIQSEGIDCDFHETESFAVFTTEKQALAGRDMYDSLRREEAFRDDLLKHVEFYIGDNAPRLTGVSKAKGYYSTPSAQLSPYKFLMALLVRCIEMGLCFRSHTAVVSLEHSDENNQVITMSHGEILTASKVVIATNAYTSALLPEYCRAIIPCKGLVCHMKGPEDMKLPRLPSSSFAIMEEDSDSNSIGYNYLIQLADNNVIVGGAHHKYDENDLGSWYNNIDDSKPIHRAQEYFEDDYLRHTFTGWEHSQAYIDRVWTGIMGYSADSLPHIGKVPNRDGILVIAGFNGHGMPVIFLAAKSIAAMVGKEVEFEQTELPSLYKTSLNRLESERNDILAGRGIRSTTNKLL